MKPPHSIMVATPWSFASRNSISLENPCANLQSLLHIEGDKFDSISPPKNDYEKPKDMRGNNSVLEKLMNKDKIKFIAELPACR
jgi:hypothetical protein